MQEFGKFEAGMAVTVIQMSLIISFLGIVSFIFGVVAENKKVSVLLFGTFLKYSSRFYTHKFILKFILRHMC